MSGRKSSRSRELITSETLLRYKLGWPIVTFALPMSLKNLIVNFNQKGE
ncbi:hypothetical protein TRIP_C60035 [Candidatus Zixiibacteriota bacterium]|nr:hypothetical protein TRIP_C60035 [candidate division Zixibacteria bacterium]